MGLERIQKILSGTGVASRREAERMVLEGRVVVNSRVVDQLGFKADPLKDHIKVDGKKLPRSEPKITLVLNKPRGYLSTVKDPAGRPTVRDILTDVKWRIYPLGRLDYDTEGLLLLTNDGDFAYRLSHPRFSIPRTYWAKIRGVPGENDLIRLRKGVILEDGRAKAVSTRMLRQREKHCWVEVVVTEGRNHLVKRMFSAIGHPVLKLKRVGYGPVRLGHLPVGHYRSLTAREMERLKEQIAKLRDQK